jgi:DNA mismatch repair protein MutS
MKIDLQTLNELEIFRDEGYGNSIFDLLNLTETTGGSDHLKALFSKPKKQIRDIVYIQDSVKYLSHNIDDWQLPVSSELMDYVEFYYFSKARIVLAKNPLEQIAEGLYHQFTCEEFKETTSKRLIATCNFIQLMWDFTKQRQNLQTPEMLRKLLTTLNKVFNIPFFAKIVKTDIKRLKLPARLRFDQALRGFYKKQIRLIFDALYDLDMISGMAKAVNHYDLKFPELIESPEVLLDIQDVYHLFIQEPQANNVNFPAQKNFMFLTGPNMAGKTAYLKSCGIAVFLAHLGMGVPASKMRLTPFDALFSNLATTDNLSEGYSCFYSEVMRVKKAAKVLQKSDRAFMLFDELFKGTNIKDAYDGSMLVINGLTKWKSSLFILSSHLIELEKEIQKLPSVFFCCFDSSVENGKPKFKFKLHNGVSTARLGHLILQNENIGELLEPV